jgi:hypothetical protein
MSQRIVLAAVVVLWGCLGTPVPIPTPIDSRLLRLSYPTHDGVMVAGLPGAASAACSGKCDSGGKVSIVVENATTGASAYGEVSAQGSFAVAVQASVGDALQVRAVVGGTRSEALAVPLPAPSGRPAPQAQVSAPDGSGLSTLDVFALAGEHPVVTLPRTGLVIAADGAFSTQQPTQAGDTIYVFATDDAGQSSEHRVLVVSVTPPACADTDGDGFGAVGSDLGACAGSTSLPDCNEANRDVHPDQAQFFSTPIPGAPAGLAFDYNCDGKEEQEVATVIACSSICGEWGWVGSVPACGQTGSWASCVLGKTGCFEQAQGSKVQACR